MKRSDINTILSGAAQFLDDRRFFLPPFARWTPEDWRQRGPDSRSVAQRKLGWDITDFGSGNFARRGLVLFTLRNGDLQALAAGRGELYAEKVLIVEPQQETPLHFHAHKTEDIINRGGGVLALELHWAMSDGQLSTADVQVSLDGVRRHVRAGDTVRLSPGESITLPSNLYHRFWAEGERVLAGEVSTVNDDDYDNFFLEPIGRFPAIEEDEPPRTLLVGDYARTGIVDTANGP